MTDPRKYAGYSAFKDWTRFFECTAPQAAQYADICSTLAIDGSTLLEVGFGAGSFLRWCRDQGSAVTGIEVQHDLLAQARDGGYTAHDSLWADGLTPSSFDFVMAFDVFEHIDIAELPSTLLRISELLKEGGLLVARFPNCQSPAGLASQFGDATHRTFLSVPVFERLTTGTGLRFAAAREGRSISDFEDGSAKVLIKRAAQRMTRLLLRSALGSGSTPLWAEAVVYARKEPRAQHSG